MKFVLFLLSAVFINQCLSQPNQQGQQIQQGQQGQWSGQGPAPGPGPVPGPGPIVTPLSPGPFPSPVPLQLNPFIGGSFGFNPIWRNPFGRRSIEDTTSSQNRTTCSYVPTESIIRCVGGQDIECQVEARLEEIRNITVRLPILNMIPEIIKIQTGKEADILRLVSRTTGSRWTLIHPKTNGEVLLSIYSSPAISEPGFMVKDAKCMDRIESLVSPSGVEGARFSLVVRA